jgi:hypothetical protein
MSDNLEKLSFQELSNLSKTLKKKIDDKHKQFLEERKQQQRKKNVDELNTLYRFEIREKIKGLTDTEEIRKIVKEITTKDRRKPFSNMSCEEVEDFLKMKKMNEVRELSKQEELLKYSKSLSTEQYKNILDNLKKK